jgi:hypothetical protein
MWRITGQKGDPVWRSSGAVTLVQNDNTCKMRPEPPRSPPTVRRRHRRPDLRNFYTLVFAIERRIVAADDEKRTVLVGVLQAAFLPMWTRSGKTLILGMASRPNRPACRRPIYRANRF